MNTLKAEKRDLAVKAKKLRREGYVTGNVFGKELEQSILRAEKMLRTDSPMEYWEEEKDDMQTVFKKINSEYECRDLYSHFQEMGIETEGKTVRWCVFCNLPRIESESDRPEYEGVAAVLYI